MPRVAVVLVAALACVVATGCEVLESLVTPTPTPPVSGSATTEGVARVDHVIDGDTLDVDIGGEIYRVRLLLLDAPEVYPEVECHGPEAREYLRDLLPPDSVVELERDVSETDRFGRLLRYVYLEDGRMVNELLLEEGHAHVVTFPPDLREVDRFRDIEDEARDEGRGLWSCADRSSTR